MCSVICLARNPLKYHSTKYVVDSGIWTVQNPLFNKCEKSCFDLVCRIDLPIPTSYPRSKVNVGDDLTVSIYSFVM